MSSVAGKVLLMPKGDYNAITTYTSLDVVLYGGLPYVAKQTTTGNLPTDTTYWQKLVDMPTQVDNVPTQNSDNLVKSGGVYSALTDKADNSAAYLTSDSAETIDDADYIPFYDASASAKKKTLWSNLKAIVTAVFTGATSQTAGVKGMVPAPTIADVDKYLKGDGTWGNVPTPSDMTGSTTLTDGAHGLVPQPLVADKDKFLRGDGSWANVPTPSDMTGASASANGAHGLVPAPLIADKDKFLKGDGTWGEVAAGDVYFEQTKTLLTNGTTRYTFTGTSDQLPTTAYYQATTNNDDVISCTISQSAAGTVTVDVPPTGTATSTTVRLYVHYANA